MSKSVEQIKNLIAKATKAAKSSRELSVKGLNFGRWWYNVGDYEQAAEWITKYLRIYDKDDKAHKLLGDIYERLNKADAALACYKSSLRVKPQQYELMLKVAEMHINPGPTQNPSRAQVWLDKAAVALPNNPQVYKLKMELLLAQEAPSAKLEEVILAELRKRPHDPSLHVQYVTFLKDQERADEAFAYSQKTDGDVSLPKAVEKDMEWNQCLIDTCQDYAERMCDDEVTPEGMKAYSLLLLSLCRYIWICMEQQKYDDALENLAMLDTSVFSALTLHQEASESSGREWDVVLNESKGQLYWLAGTYIIYMATQNRIQWGEAVKLAAACYGFSQTYTIPDTSAPWATWSEGASFPQRMKLMAGFRLSQCGHMMYNLISTSHTAHKEERGVNEREWMLKVTDNYCTDEGRRKVFDHLFGRNYNPETSMLYNDSDFSRAVVCLVSEEDLCAYDNGAIMDLSLQTWVWSGLQWRQNFDNALDPFSWISTAFSELHLTSSTAKYGHIWQLCSLDLESFIVACVLLAQKACSMLYSTHTEAAMLEQSRLPLPMGKNLATDLQRNWWEAACKLHCARKKERIINANQLKATLRHGMESIRGSGNHGLQLMLIADLAKHFAAKAYNIDKQGLGTSSGAWLAYQRRAAHYWTLALPLLQDVSVNKIKQQIEPKDRLFPKTLDEPTMQEAQSMISEVFMCNGGLLVQEGDLKGALDTYAKADTPHASFCEALIFKQLLESCMGEEYSFTTGSASKRKEGLRKKYQARLEVTMNRLHRQPDNELLRRVEALAHPSGTPQNRSIGDEPDGENLHETIPKHPLHPGNQTVNFEEDDSILAIPGKQSTPKSDLGPLDYIPQNKGIVAQISQNLSALTSAVSSLQAQQKQEQEKSTTEQKDQATIGLLCDKLSALTDALSSLHVKEEQGAQQRKIMEQQLLALQEQVNRTHLGTPTHASHLVRLPQGDASVPGTPLQVFDQYQHAALGQVASPGPGSPYYGMLPYQTYPVQNTTVAYTPQGYPVPQGVPAYSVPQRPQHVVDPRVLQSPVNTPPRPPQQHNVSTGLPMSKEGADALSVRFQALSGSVPQHSGVRSPAVGMIRPPQQQTSFVPAAGVPGVDGRPTPPAYGTSTMGTPQQGRMTHAYSEPVIGNSHPPPPMSVFARIGQPAPTAAPPQPQPAYKPNERSQLDDYGYDSSYLSPQNQGTVQPQPGQEGASVLRSLLISKQQANEAAAAQAAQKVEIKYPGHINFPQDQNEKSTGTGWTFKFQTPEDMDRENKKLEADEEAEDADASHNDTGPHFEPIVSLPEVEVRTGEEDEEAVFSERAKLYRWCETEWKERGLGNMKILKHKETGKYRLVMRREQVLKICCNHIIGKDMELNPMMKSDRAWVWHAVDFSEEESKLEKFAIRFKSPEIALAYKEKVMLGKTENIKLAGGTPTRPGKAAMQPTVSTAVTSKTTTAASGIFTSTLKDTNSSNNEPTIPKFKFAFPKPSSAALDLAAKIAGSPKQPEPDKEAEETDEVDGGPHNEGDGPHFEPVIKLPDKVDTKTGEEDEEVLFCHRAKLYRYTDNQWKERGLGDIKILHNKDTNKFRVVMRREQVLKLCANHYITADMTLSAHGNSDKSWAWSAMDHSDPDAKPQPELLVVRFKEAETAAEFKKHFDSAKGGSVTSAPVQKPQSASTTKVTTSGIFKLASYATDNMQTSSQSIQSSKVDSTTGQKPLTVVKAAGEWSCPTCCTSNGADEAVCPCCQTPNPAAPKPAAQASGNKFGTGFSFGAANKSAFSFGIPSSSSPAPKPSIFAAAPAPAAAPSDKPAFKPLVAKSEPGSWNCSGCGVSNGKDEASCPCCGTANPSVKAEPKAPSSGMQPGLFSLGGANKGAFSFGIPAKSSADSAPKPTPEATTSGMKPGLFSLGGANKSGFSFGIPKTTGESPAAANAPKPDPPKPGLFNPDAVQKGGFSFGVAQQTAEQVPATSGTVVSPPKFMFANKQSSGFAFGAQTSSFNQNNSVGQNAGLFSSKLQSSPGTSAPMPSSGIPKPRFPSVGDEEDYSEDEDSDGTTGSSYSPSSDENDYDVNAQQYRSPLMRQQESQDDVVGGEDDVICLGEILPPPELQERAEKFGLPKHFYNFLKEGEDPDDDAESTASEDVRPKPKLEATKSLAFVTTSAATAVTSGFQTTSAPSFGFATTSSSTFASLAQTGAGSGFTLAGDKGGWKGLVDKGPLFANLRQGDGDVSKEGEDLYQTDEKDDLHFEPVVKLPEKVNVVTGEEDDETIYSQRCKLFRWNNPTNEWKERGVGEIKMLRNKVTGRIRILMRREQVLKVCANHYIRPGMTLELNKGSDRAWTWTAMDFTDDEDPKMEKFAARFKNIETAFEFKENFEKCQMLLLDADPMTPCKASTTRTKEMSDKTEKMKNELQFFKDKFSEPTKIDLNNTLTDESNLAQTTVMATVGSLTPLVAQHKETMRKSLREKAEQNDSSGATHQEKTTPTADASFSFQLRPNAPQKLEQKQGAASPSRRTTVSVSEDPQAEPDVHFEPIVQLPEHVELVTGEEDEQILFGNRAKLYMFDAEGSQWKERGLGDIKILQNIKSCKVRVLMRREQVLKVCLNHLIQSAIKVSFKEKSAEKVLLWTANDFSDDEYPEGKVQKFALRFKDADRARLFRNIWTEGSEASESETLLDQDPSAINTSTVGAGATSPGPGPAALSPQSPTSPVKPVMSSFSFANVQSPIKPNAQTSNEKQVEIMGFVFGKTPEKKAAAAPNDNFNFDMSKMSFNFGPTSTPQTRAKESADSTSSTMFFTPTQDTPTVKFGGTLFGGKSKADETDGSVASSLFSTPNETITRSEATIFSGDQSPALQPKPKPNVTQIAQQSAYKPSPLATGGGGLTQMGKGFFQGGSGKFQFKPTTSAPASKPEDIPSQKSEPAEDDDDVIFVSEAKPSEDQRKRAERLLLPPTFFLYEDKEWPEGYDEKSEEEKEDMVLRYIQDRDSGAEDPGKTFRKPTSDIVPGKSGTKKEANSTDTSTNSAVAAKPREWVFGGDGQGPASFAAMATTVQSVGFKVDPSFRFPGAGQVMFQDQGDTGDDPSNYRCEAQFKPVLEELPPVIDVKTGEEGEEVVYKERCKLYRFDTDTNQWKERGVGEIKILHNTEHKLYRVVMRRDQVLKVCANHVIHEDTDPQPHLGSLKTCSYFAMDYSENMEPKPEKFAVRFKTEDICKAYTDKINEVKFLKD